MSQPPEVFQPLARRRSLGEDIGVQLQRLIQDRTYPPGSTLPSQRDLARMFGTSVSSVREAISVLVATGVLDARRGHGTVVRSITRSESEFDGWLGVASDPDEFRELLEARHLLEHFTMHTAAQRLTPAAKRALNDILMEMRAALHDPEAYVDADMRLHMTLAAVAGNRVVSRLMRAIQYPLRFQLTQSVRQLYSSGRLQDSLSDHEEMLEALYAGEAEQAFSYIGRMIGRAARLNDSKLSSAEAGVSPVEEAAEPVIFLGPQP